MNAREIEKLRASIYRVTPSRRIRNITAAARFIDQVGFCWLFAPAPGIPELPSLFEAVKGRRGARIFDWDEDSDRVWGWKNDLPAGRRAYYGKGLMGRPVFVSLELLPFVLAAAGREQFDRLYAHGGISYEAKKIYEALGRLGPQPTKMLRAAAGVDSKSGTARFHRGLDELQRGLFILPVGAVSEGGPWVSQIFELTSRWFAEETARAQKLDSREAWRTLVKRYLNTVIAAKPSGIGRLFRLPREQVQSIIQELLAERFAYLSGEWIIRFRTR